MDFLEIALPIVLLALAFLLKLLIDRTATIPYFVHALLELPVDIAFLATSFVVAFTIATPSSVKSGLLTFCLYISVAVVLVFIWRRSMYLFECDRLVSASLLALVNYVVSAYGLAMAIGIVTKSAPRAGVITAFNFFFGNGSWL